MKSRNESEDLPFGETNWSPPDTGRSMAKDLFRHIVIVYTLVAVCMSVREAVLRAGVSVCLFTHRNIMFM